MLSTRKLTSDQDLTRYAALYQAKSGFAVELDYLRVSHVRIFYYAARPEKWLAGYVQNGNGMLRYLHALPADCDRPALLARMGVAATDILETCCIFLDRLPPLDRQQVYRKVVQEAYRSDKAVLLGGSILPRVAAYQMQSMPHLLVAVETIHAGKKVLMQEYYGYRNEFLWRSLGVFGREWLAALRHYVQRKTARHAHRTEPQSTPVASGAKG